MFENVNNKEEFVFFPQILTEESIILGKGHQEENLKLLMGKLSVTFWYRAIHVYVM